MGYSCTARASYTLEALLDLIGGKTSNGLPGDMGFYEIGREREDGAIVGTVWRKVRTFTDAERAARAAEMSRGGCEVRPGWVGDPCRRAGSFHVRADGTIKAFPYIAASMRRQAEERGSARYSEVHECRRDWREVAQVLADQLAGPGPAVGSPELRARAYWRNVEAIAADYQREAGVAFLAMPACECAAMASFLREIAAA